MGSTSENAGINLQSLGIDDEVVARQFKDDLEADFRSVDIAAGVSRVYRDNVVSCHLRSP